MRKFALLFLLVFIYGYATHAQVAVQAIGVDKATQARFDSLARVLKKQRTVHIEEDTLEVRSPDDPNKTTAYGFTHKYFDAAGIYMVKTGGTNLPLELYYYKDSMLFKWEGFDAKGRVVKTFYYNPYPFTEEENRKISEAAYLNEAESVYWNTLRRGRELVRRMKGYFRARG
jgi:hypothetical protein